MNRQGFLRLTGLVAVSLLASVSLPAQTAQTFYFRGVMTTANETPPVTDIVASGQATIAMHVVRDGTGKVTSGSVDFSVNYVFPAAGQIFTGLHIHSAAAGVAGPVTVNTGLNSTNTVTSTAAGGNITRQAQVKDSDTAGLATLNGMLADPSQYYVNLHTTVYPGGVIRAQLQKADVVYLSGQMSPANEVPPIANYDAAGTAAVTAIAARDASGNITSGTVTLSASYRFPKQVTLSGFHIHTGSALISGPVTINSTLTSTLSDPSGTGVVSLTVDVPPVAGASLSALQGLFANPSNYYINIHTSDFPGGIIRATLRKADLQTFQVTMLPSNEVPAVTCAGCSGIANVGIATISGSDGSVVGGFAIFDVNYRLPAATNITGLHIHDGNSTVSGPVRINTGITSQPTTSDGFGNVFVMAPAQLTAASLVTLNSILVSPENQYVNLHTTELPGGAFRSQLAAANTAVPAITGATNAVFSTAVTGVAPLGLASVFGTNLSKVTADLGGGNTLPDSLGGTTLTVGGKLARLLFVSPAQINFQVPESAASGSQALAVSNVNGAGPASTITVAATAPAIFSNASGSGAILKNIDFSMVSAANPATAGDLVLVFSTGLGLTTPPLATGDLAPIYPTYQTAPTTATIGGQAATVVYSVAAPGFAGLYQTALQVPTGLTPGSVNVALTVGGVTSNTVTMTVK